MKKPQSDLQKLACKRNRLKMRLVGSLHLFARQVGYSDEEKFVFDHVTHQINGMLRDWDDNSIQLGLTPTKAKRCVACFKNRVPYRIQRNCVFCKKCVDNGAMLSFFEV